MAQLFRFTEEGELIPIGDVNVLSDEDTAIAVDDLGGKVLLLLGANVSGLMRAKAMRAARNLRLQSGRRHELVEVEASQRDEWLKSIADSLSKDQPIQVATIPSPSVSYPPSPFVQSSAGSVEVTEPEVTEPQHEPLYHEEPESIEEPTTSSAVEPRRIEPREPLDLEEIDPEDLDYLASFFGAYLLGLPVSKVRKVLNFRIDPRMRSHVLDYIRERAVEFFDSFYS